MNVKRNSAKKRPNYREFLEKPNSPPDSGEQSGGEQSDPEQHDHQYSPPQSPTVEQSKILQRPATPPRLDELLSSEAIGEGTMEERRREFLSRLVAFTARIYKPEGRVNYCKFCKKTYSNDTNFKVHMATLHLENKEYHCERCDKKFGMWRLLKRHQEFYCKAAFKCSKCKKPFSNSEALAEHKLTHKTKTEKCEVCGKCFGSKMALKGHKLLHSSETPYQCTAEGCEERFHTKVKRLQHIDEKHTTEEADYRHVCKVCNNKFQTRFLLLVHLNKAHKIKRPRHYKPRKPFLWKCEECGKEIICKQSVKPHMMLHAKGLKPPPPKRESYPCTVCNVEIKTKKDLNIHMRTVHNMGLATLKHKCAACNLTFASRIPLMTHLRTAHSIYQCLECKAEFGSQIERKRHRITVHALQTKSGDGHACKLCRAKLRSAKELLGHMRLVHSVYRCGKCEQEFSNEQARTTHFRKEHKTKNPCKHCNQEFSTSSRLTDHVMSMHTGYRCRDCGSVFPNLYAKRRHRRLMHPKPPCAGGVRLHKCIDCNGVFPTLHEKKQHRKLMHPRPSTASTIPTDYSEFGVDFVGVWARTLPIVGSEAKTLPTVGSGMRNRETTSCQVCGRLCATEWHLSEHIKIHTK